MVGIYSITLLTLKESAIFKPNKKQMLIKNCIFFMLRKTMRLVEPQNQSSFVVTKSRAKGSEWLCFVLSFSLITEIFSICHSSTAGGPCTASFAYWNSWFCPCDFALSPPSIFLYYFFLFGYQNLFFILFIS